MPRIRSDPNLNLISEDVTEEQAIQLLKNIWQANNNTEKYLWQQQVNDDREEQAHCDCLEEDKEERLKQECLAEEEEARKDERKKNKHKYTPIQNMGILDDPAITPCSYALRKLDKGEYVEMWYFTNNGLDEAAIKKTIDNDAMILMGLGSVNAHSVVNDENLPFEDFCQACPRFITMLQEADWPQDRIRIMVLFWRNLQVHKYRLLRDPWAQKTLLLHQVEQCKRWHIVAKSTAGPYDISEINEKVLEETRGRVYWEERLKSDNARDYKVSISSEQYAYPLLVVPSFL
ncbi:hypothetical protein F4604DRAFT_1903725 [Suillus subluteus]|nr:hypothetical protein F4604DRAFT_1903725 [Suillus subluteus]